MDNEELVNPESEKADNNQGYQARLGILSGLLSSIGYLVGISDGVSEAMFLVGLCLPGLIWALCFGLGNGLRFSEIFLLLILAGFVSGFFCFFGTLVVFVAPLIGGIFLGFLAFCIMVISLKGVGIITSETAPFRYTKEVIVTSALFTFCLWLPFVVVCFPLWQIVLNLALHDSLAVVKKTDLI